MATCDKAHPRWLFLFLMKLSLVGAICSAFILLYMCMCGVYTCVIASVWTSMSGGLSLILVSLFSVSPNFAFWHWTYTWTTLITGHLFLSCIIRTWAFFFFAWMANTLIAELLPQSNVAFQRKIWQTENNSRAQLSTLEIWKNLSTSHMWTDDPQSPASTSVTKGLGPIIINSLIMKSIPCSRI